MVNHQPAEQMFMMKLILAWQAWQREKSHRYVLPVQTNNIIKEVPDGFSYMFVYFQVGTVDPVGDFRTMISQRDEDRFDEGIHTYVVSSVPLIW